MRRSMFPVLGSVALSLSSPSAVAGVAITPRVARYFDNTVQRILGRNLDVAGAMQTELGTLNDLLQQVFGPTAEVIVDDAAFAVTSEQLDYTLEGLGITFDLKNDKTQLAFTYLQGEDTVASRQVTRSTVNFTLGPFVTSDLWVGSSEITYGLEREDIEFTFQHRLNETFSLIGGARLEKNDLRAVYNSTLEHSVNMENLIGLLTGGGIEVGLGEPVLTSTEATTSAKTYSLRFGGAAYAPLGERGLFFASALVHYSQEDGDAARTTTTGNGPVAPLAGTVPEADERYYGPDLTVGYVRRFGERVDFDVRYRATAYYPESESDNPRVNHGPSIGFSFWFGD